jgi:hypothetical protein
MSHRAPSDESRLGFTVVEWGTTGKGPLSTRPAQRRAAGVVKPRLPREPELEMALPQPYRDHVKTLGLTLVMDNTLRRIRAGSRAYPSRVRPAQGRGLVADDGEHLSETGADALDDLDRCLGGAYPPSLLE